MSDWVVLAWWWSDPTFLHRIWMADCWAFASTKGLKNRHHKLQVTSRCVLFIKLAWNFSFIYSVYIYHEGYKTFVFVLAKCDILSWIGIVGQQRSCNDWSYFAWWPEVSVGHLEDIASDWIRRGYTKQQKWFHQICDQRGRFPMFRHVRTTRGNRLVPERSCERFRWPCLWLQRCPYCQIFTSLEHTCSDWGCTGACFLGQETVWSTYKNLRILRQARRVLYHRF